MLNYYCNSTVHPCGQPIYVLASCVHITYKLNVQVNYRLSSLHCKLSILGKYYSVNLISKLQYLSDLGEL